MLRNWINHEIPIWHPQNFPVKSTVLLGLLLILPCITYAQADSSSRQYYRLPIIVTYGNQDVAFGLQNLFAAYNPSVALGTEIVYNKSQRHKIGQSAELGFIANETLGNKTSLSTAFFYRYCHRSGLFAGIELGLGLAQQYHPRQVYEYNAELRDYEKAKDTGISSLQAGYGLHLGYDFARNGDIPLSIFIKNNLVIQSPYLDLTTFPIMPQSITQLGLKIQLTKK